MTYYEVLGVRRTASNKEIQDAFRALCFKWHPDVSAVGKEEAEKKFKEIAEAFRILRDPESRRSYDEYLSSWYSGATTFAEWDEAHFWQDAWANAKVDATISLQDLLGMVDDIASPVLSGAGKVVQTTARVSQESSWGFSSCFVAVFFYVLFFGGLVAGTSSITPKSLPSIGGVLFIVALLLTMGATTFTMRMLTHLPGGVSCGGASLVAGLSLVGTLALIQVAIDHDGFKLESYRQSQGSGIGARQEENAKTDKALSHSNSRAPVFRHIAIRELAADFDRDEKVTLHLYQNKTIVVSAKVQRVFQSDTLFVGSSEVKLGVVCHFIGQSLRTKEVSLREGDSVEIRGVLTKLSSKNVVILNDCEIERHMLHN